MSETETAQRTPYAEASKAPTRSRRATFGRGSLLLAGLLLPLSPALVAAQADAGTVSSPAAQAAPASAVPATALQAPSRSALEPSKPEPAAEPAPELKAEVADKPATLQIWNRSIAVFRASIGQATPQVRAESAAQRIESLPDRFLLGNVRAARSQFGGLHGEAVTVNDVVLFGLLEEDIDPLDPKPLAELGSEAAGQLRKALAARADQRRPAVLIRGAAQALAASLLLLLLFLAWQRLRRIGAHFLEPLAARMQALKLFDFDLGAGANRALQWSARTFARLVQLVIVYLWLTFVLSRFPYTEPWGLALGSWLFDTFSKFGQAVLGAVPNLVKVGVILYAARGLSRLFDQALVRAENGEYTASWLHADTARATRRIAVFAIWLLAIALAYPFLPGSSTSAFQGVTVVLGLMFSFGSAGLSVHLLAGLVIIYSRGLRVGDFVRVGDHVGAVTALGPFSIKLANYRGQEVTIPNAVVTASVIVNYSRLSKHGGLAASTTVTIGYDAPWRQVEALLERAAAKTPGLCAEVQPHVLQRALGDYYVEYELIVELAPQADYVSVLDDIHAHIQDEFNEHGVQIMSPHFMSQPPEAVVVPKSRWFADPAKPEAKS